MLNRFGQASIICFMNWLTFKPLNTYQVTDPIDHYIKINFN